MCVWILCACNTHVCALSCYMLRPVLLLVLTFTLPARSFKCMCSITCSVCAAVYVDSCAFTCVDPLPYRLCLPFTNFSEGGMKIINRLRQILKMDQRSKLEEEREQQVPSSPTVQPPSPVPETVVEDVGAVLEAAVGGGGGGEGVEPPQRRLSSSNRLQRQDQSIREGRCPCFYLMPTIILCYLYLMPTISKYCEVFGPF